MPSDVHGSNVIETAARRGASAEASRKALQKVVAEYLDLLDDDSREGPRNPQQVLADIKRMIADLEAPLPTPAEREAAWQRLVGSLPGSSALYDRAKDWAGCDCR